MDPPKHPDFFINLLYFSYTYFSNSLIIQAKFHKIAKYIILYSKMDLLQPESLKIKKLPLKNYAIKKSFSSDITDFLIEVK